MGNYGAPPAMRSFVLGGLRAARGHLFHDQNPHPRHPRGAPLGLWGTRSRGRAGCAPGKGRDKRFWLGVATATVGARRRAGVLDLSLSSSPWSRSFLFVCVPIATRERGLAGRWVISRVDRLRRSRCERGRRSRVARERSSDRWRATTPLFSANCGRTRNANAKRAWHPAQTFTFRVLAPLADGTASV